MRPVLEDMFIGPVASHLAFFNERVDAIYVDDELMPKPKTPWSEE